MFRKKQRELTTEDAPDSIAPWEMLNEAEMADQTSRVQAQFPDRTLVAFARRLDQDTLACFDKGPDGTSKAVLVLEHWNAPRRSTEHRYPGFGDWFDAALAEHHNQ